MRAALQAALGGSRGTADGILLDLGVSSMQVRV
jgi:16S rRNA C1402 N4-methylase RsmH